MAIYRVQAPDGSILRMEGPENATQEQLAQAVSAYAKAAQVPAQTPEKPPLAERVKDVFTGDLRATPETGALPDWATMPELNSFSLASAKTGLGTLLANPAEAVKIIQHNFPGVQARQDEKGNFLLRSSIDGKEYAIKPGFQISDLPRALGGIAAFTPAGRATTVLGTGAAAAGTQAAIEVSQAATGGEINPGEVVTAGVVGAAVPAVVNAVRAAANPAKQMLQNLRKSPDAAPVAEAPNPARPAPAVEPVAAEPPAAPRAPAANDPAMPAAPVEPLPSGELNEVARKAAEGGIGSKRATQVLAEQAAPDQKVVEAAKRLGIEDYLQPDHVTTNQAYRELAQAVKSIPGSEARAVELQGLEQVAKRADDLIEQIGGTHDVSALDVGVKKALQATHAELKSKADDLYKQIREAIPAKSDAPAPNVLKMIEARADELGGTKNLSPMEKMILGKLSPKTASTAEQVAGNPLMPGQQSATVRQVPVTRQPTYALLDDVRRDLTAAKYARQGPFKDSDDRLITMLEGALRKDQEAAAQRYGMAEKWNLAQQTAATYKGIQDDLSALFGKNLDQSLVGDLSGAVRALPAGDTSKFLQLLKSIPEDMRQEVVASGLNTALGKSAKNGTLNFSSYAKWYEGLLRNKRAYAALMANLPPSARKQLSDLYRVSKSISLASKERITTGRINAVTEQLKGTDSLVANLYGLAKRSAVGAAAEAVTTPLGMPGAGISAGIASALTKGKSNAMKAADALIASPEFNELAKKAGTSGEKAARLRLVYSKPFTRFVRAVGQPRELSNRERWVLQSMQAQNNQQR